MLGGTAPTVGKVLRADAVDRLTRRAREVYLDERIRDYIVALVTATRRPRDLRVGVAAGRTADVRHHRPRPPTTRALAGHGDR